MHKQIYISSNNIKISNQFQKNEWIRGQHTSETARAGSFQCKRQAVPGDITQGNSQNR